MPISRRDSHRTIMAYPEGFPFIYVVIGASPHSWSIPKDFHPFRCLSPEEISTTLLWPIPKDFHPFRCLSPEEIPTTLLWPIPKDFHQFTLILIGAYLTKRFPPHHILTMSIELQAYNIRTHAYAMHTRPHSSTNTHKPHVNRYVHY